MATGNYTSYRERQIQEEKNRKAKNRKRLAIILLLFTAFLTYWLLSPCSNIDCLKEYFPLAIRNEFTYERTVNQPPLTNYPVQTREGGFDMLGEENVHSGIEKFKIAKRQDDEFIVEGEGIEPYGLETIQQLIWAHRVAEGQFVILHEGRKGNTTMSATALSYLLIDPSHIISQDATGFKYENEYHRFMFINKKPYLKVLKCTKTYPAGRDRTKVKIERYFVKGVGLVKEIQWNSENEVAYTLELKSYKIKN